MKRFALLTVLLLVLATLGFADDVLKPGLAITGSATLSWGIDLDNMSTGFLNSTDVAVDLTLVSGYTQEKAGTGGVYGVIKVSDFDVAINFVTDGVFVPAFSFADWSNAGDFAVEAYIVAGALQVGVYGAPAMEGTKAVAVEADDGTDNAYGDIMVADDEAPAVSAYSIGGYGTYVQYTVGPVVAKLVAKSDAEYGVNATNGYAFGAEAVVTFKPVTLGLGGYFSKYELAGYTGEDIPVFWATAAFAQGMFAVDAAFDLALDPNYDSNTGAALDSTIVWDTSLGATVTLKEDTTVKLMGYWDSNDNLDLKASFVEPAAGGFVPNLGVSVDAYFLDLLNPLHTPAAPWESLVTATVSYAIGKFTPEVGIAAGGNTNDADTFGDDVGKDQFFNVSVGVSTSMFDNVTLKAKWTSGDFISYVSYGASDYDPAFYSGELGQIVFSAAIAL